MPLLRLLPCIRPSDSSIAPTTTTTSADRRGADAGAYPGQLDATALSEPQGIEGGERLPLGMSGGAVASENRRSCCKRFLHDLLQAAVAVIRRNRLLSAQVMKLLC